MKILVYIGSHDNNSINEALEQLDNGNEVLAVCCDKSLGLCRDNYYGSKPLCQLCIQANKVWKKKLAEKGAKVITLSNIIEETDVVAAKDFTFKYNDVKSLKGINYKGVEIGFGAFSTYVSISKNVMPEFSRDFLEYENFLMRKEIIMTSALERVILQYKPDLIIFHNGRFAEYKPILCLSQKYNVNYIATEEVHYKGKVLKNNFYNSVVHNIYARYQNYKNNWETGKESEDQKIELAKTFFVKRRNKQAAGDKIYTKDQEFGLLPTDFSNNAEVISIFNSSEHEFCAVSTEHDKNMLYENQYVALKTLFDRYKDDKSKHFYLRIHPNLKNVPYKSHTKLYDLKYDNVTIIPPTSPIDSYELMDRSDKIIIFNSTMGVECAYWKKPVIALTKHVWSLMGVTYTPETQEELWQLIETKSLPCRYNDNCLKYAYWVLHPNYPEEKYIHFEDVSFNVLGEKVFQGHQFLKICGSIGLYTFLRLLLTRKTMMKALSPFSYFTHIPCTVNK